MLDLSSPEIRAAIADRIGKDYDDASIRLFDEGHRKHLGASVIGRPCEAEIWFAYRWFRKVNPGGRMYRLFQRGHREEPFVFAHYRQAGFTVNELDPSNGKQWRLSALHGHFGGSCDGRGYLPASYDYPFEVGYEVKTANEKQFKKAKTDGVAKWQPKYARQMDVYGRAWGIAYFVFIVVNKNDDDKYIEIYECKPVEADHALVKAERIITARSRPTRISEHPSFSECRYCDFANNCHRGAMPEVNCRSCWYSIPSHDGQWFCNGYNAHIPDDVIRVGCSAWKSIV